MAWAIGDSNPLVNVLGLWCVNEIDTKLFSAQIGREAFTKIRKSSILALHLSLHSVSKRLNAALTDKRIS